MQLFTRFENLHICAHTAEKCTRFASFVSASAGQGKIKAGAFVDA